MLLGLLAASSLATAPGGLTITTTGHVQSFAIVAGAATGQRTLITTIDNRLYWMVSPPRPGGGTAAPEVASAAAFILGAAKRTGCLVGFIYDQDTNVLHQLNIAMHGSQCDYPNAVTARPPAPFAPGSPWSPRAIAESLGPVTSVSITGYGAGSAELVVNVNNAAYGMDSGALPDSTADDLATAALAFTSALRPGCDVVLDALDAAPGQTPQATHVRLSMANGACADGDPPLPMTPWVQLPNAPATSAAGRPNRSSVLPGLPPVAK